MTDQQFDTIVSALNGIQKAVERLMGEPDAKSKYDLSDVYSELDSITRAVGGVESAISK